MTEPARPAQQKYNASCPLHLQRQRFWVERKAYYYVQCQYLYNYIEISHNSLLLEFFSLFLTIVFITAKEKGKRKGYALKHIHGGRQVLLENCRSKSVFFPQEHFGDKRQCCNSPEREENLSKSQNGYTSIIKQFFKSPFVLVYTAHRTSRQTFWAFFVVPLGPSK